MINFFEKKKEKIERLEKELSKLRHQMKNLYRKGGAPSPLVYVPRIKKIVETLKKIKPKKELYINEFNVGDTVLYRHDINTLKGTICDTKEYEYRDEWDGQTYSPYGDPNYLIPVIPYERRLCVVFDPADDVSSILYNGKKNGSFLKWVGNEQFLIKEFIYQSTRKVLNTDPHVERNISKLVFVDNINI